MSDKLYYSDSHLRSFEATVVSSFFNGKYWETALDRTAFFPEGGGQRADTGTLGGVAVLDVQEKGGEIVHFCDGELAVGASVRGEIDWEKRFSNMQSHSGEHIVSGIVHNRFGFDNVGFHMGADGIIVDFDGYISPEELREVELEANRIIWENRSIRAYFPDPALLPSLSYRSKLELTENVRLVEIEGVDLCACCAPHVSRTGEIGMIRILDSQRRREGVRIRMLAGSAALADAISKDAVVSEASRLLSAKPENVGEAISRVLRERDDMQYRLRGLRIKEIDGIVAAIPEGAVNFCHISDDYAQADDLMLIKGALPRCRGVVFTLTGGDEGGYRFIIASESVKLRNKIIELREKFEVKGGGSDAMAQGSVVGSAEAIKSVIEGWYSDENN